MPLFGNASDTVVSVDKVDKALCSVFKRALPHCQFKTINEPKSAIQALLEKKADFAIIPANTLTLENQPVSRLRSVMALYPQILTLVTSANKPIHHLQDITTYSLHTAATSTQAQYLLEQISPEFDLANNKILDFKEAVKALRSHKLDGFFVLCVHPSANMTALHKELNTTIVPLYGKKFDQLHNDKPYIIKNGIPKGMYGLKADLKSIGVKTLLITREDVNASIVENLTTSLLENIDTLKENNFIYRSLYKKTALEGLLIPQHKGAFKAFNAF